MKNPLLATLSLIALAGLGACGQAPVVQGGNGATADPMEDNLANAAPVELPPPLKASKTYRCKDNSLVFIDFFADDTGANIRTDKAGKPTRLKASEKGKPFEGDGFSVKGDGGSTATVTVPGKSAQECKA